MATRDDDAGSEPLQIPFPRSGKGLVEVVDVENDVALRRREPSEIQQVGVASGLHDYSGPRSMRQIGRHDCR
jgi:hypothetical protein